MRHQWLAMNLAMEEPESHTAYATKAPDAKGMTMAMCSYKSQQRVALGGEGADRDFDAHWIDAESSFPMLGSQL